MITIDGKPVDYVAECQFCKKPVWKKTMTGTKLSNSVISPSGIYHKECKKKETEEPTQ